MNPSDEHYRQLLKEELETGRGGARKRRRVGRHPAATAVTAAKTPRNNGLPISTAAGVATTATSARTASIPSNNESTWPLTPQEVVVLSSDESSAGNNQPIGAGDFNSDSDDFEDVDLDKAGSDSEDFEDVDIDPAAALRAPQEAPETFTIAINREEAAPKARRFVPVPKEERLRRRSLHQMCLVLMIIHGAIRNRWCNDYSLGTKLKRVVSPAALALLDQPATPDVLNTVKSRRFLDGLQKVLRAYSAKFRVSGEGIKRKNWNELDIPQSRRFRNVDFARFKELISSFRGSRDLAAQGFVCLLRTVGLNARLVFSLQPPDFTIIATLPKIEPAPAQSKRSPSPVNQNLGANSKSRILASVRSRSTNVTEQHPTQPVLEDAPFPVFWAEVWNPYSKKWVSIDPAVLEILENAPMRSKSKFEPPQSEPRNQLYYAIAYNKFGAIRDVTRRYTHFFNAKTAKKRIAYKSEDDQYWYERVLAGINSSSKSKPTTLDIMESKEFYDRDLVEGMPNNITDFNNHPIYALESQLKQNEVIYPMDNTSKCGTFRAKTSSRSKSSSGVIPVYKRAHVYMLRSAKAWYMRGRVLKVGVQALKVKKKSVLQKKNEGSDGEEDEHTNLYAEFQTKLFIPQPIQNGMIPKNVYGNIDLYAPSMMPEGGCLIDTTGQYTMKMAEHAARSILEIDHAKAIIAFDFGKAGKASASGRVPAAREGGIVVCEEYKEAIIAVLDALVEEEEQTQRDRVKMNSLKYWKFFLTKLRISERLNRQHGKIEKPESEVDEMDSDSDNFSVYDDTSGSEISDHEGGFVVEDARVKDSAGRDEYDSDGENGGGFLREATTESQGEHGGFIHSESEGVHNEETYPFDENGSDTGGGFFNEQDADYGVAQDQQNVSEEFEGSGLIVEEVNTPGKGMSSSTDHLNNSSPGDGLDSDETGHVKYISGQEGGFLIENQDNSRFGEHDHSEDLEHHTRRKKLGFPNPSSIHSIDVQKVPQTVQVSPKISERAVEKSPMSRHQHTRSHSDRDEHVDTTQSSSEILRETPKTKEIRSPGESPLHGSNGPHEAGFENTLPEKNVGANDDELDLPDELFSYDAHGCLVYAPQGICEGEETDGVQAASEYSDKHNSEDELETSRGPVMDSSEEKEIMDEEDAFGFQYSDSE